MNNIKINNLARISKRTARSMYEMYFTVELIPHKINPRSLWMEGHAINKVIEEGRDFNNIINEYEYFNCSNEAGRYVAYYTDESNIQLYETYYKNKWRVL